jgi:hypothetical protein
MRTASARRALRDPVEFGADTVTSLADLLASGWTYAQIQAQVDAGRWQRIGRAIIRHNGTVSQTELNAVALITVSSRTLLTSFSALTDAGLRGWPDDRIHVRVPRGARVSRPTDLPLRIHYTDRWAEIQAGSRRQCDAPVQAALLAAASFRSSRPACGVMCAVVQQRLVRADELIVALQPDRRLRHRRLLLAAAWDITQGAQALSEIDFVRLCRRHGLPEPIRQAIRVDPHGRRRYLDAEWQTRSGRRLVVEVDGALHLAASTWWADQSRQNELVLVGDTVLRFPSAVVRADDPVVSDQLRRGLAM